MIMLMASNLKKENMAIKGLSGTIDMKEEMLSLTSSTTQYNCSRTFGLM